jgi:hypothetical protein
MQWVLGTDMKGEEGKTKVILDQKIIDKLGPLKMNSVYNVQM